jgi:hypothetical protein
MSGMFDGALRKMSIGSAAPDFEFDVTAQYNPKELQIDQAYTWNAHKGTDNQGDDDDPMFLEFGGVQPSTMKVELLFDAYETPNTYDINDDIAKLKKLAMVREESPANDKRPYFILVTWGDGLRFRGVIDGLSIKYTMFSPKGKPLRATVTVSFKEANQVQQAKKRPK